MLLNCIDVHFCYTVGLHVISGFFLIFFLYIFFIHRTIAITPFHEFNMCVCIYLWWPSYFSRDSGTDCALVGVSRQNFTVVYSVL